MNPLAVFFKYIKSYYSLTFKLIYFLLITAMLSVILFINYTHHSFWPIVNGYPWAYRFLWYYFLYLIPFGAAFLLQYFFYDDTRFLKNKYFIALLLLAPAYFSFRVNFNFHHPLLKNIWDGDELIIWQRCIDWLIRSALLIVLVWLTWYFTKKDNEPLYGISKTVTLKPYFVALLCMIPLITLAAVQPDFLHFYPRAKVIAPLHLVNKLLYYFLFELSYAFDFVSIELFFRGFLIIAFIRYCGIQCIAPAACFYCCIHLGKPMGEAISSFFGGLLLGIISYNTKSIKGGFILHVGIAAMMEIAGFTAHLYLK